MSTMRVEDWLKAKYLGDSPGSDRFQNVHGEYHASSFKCVRQSYYKYTREREDEWSPYFELGNRFEDIYGAALAFQYSDVDDDELAYLSNEELIERTPRVAQDVTCNIVIDEGVHLTGESDWVVLEEGFDQAPNHVELRQDGTRRIEWEDGHETYSQSSPIDRVVETKTTKKREWREEYGHKKEHEYQVRTYMWAFDCVGEIAYIIRNDLDELVYDFERDENIEKELEIQTRMLHMKLDEEELPDADPARPGICKWCDWKAECKVEGGTRWS